MGSTYYSITLEMESELIVDCSIVREGGDGDIPFDCGIVPASVPDIGIGLESL